MRLSSVLHIQKLLAKLHPPLFPSTPRETQRLLAVINGSFKQNLDAAHPAPRPVDADLGVDSGQEKSSNTSIIATQTDTQLNSILNHPIVKGNRVADCESIAHEFDADIVSGTMSPAQLHNYAVKYLKAGAGREVPNKFRLGARIGSWLQGGTQSSKQALIAPASPDVVRLMYLDGREDAVWKWLEALYQAHHVVASSFRDSGLSHYYLTAEDQLVRLMIRQALNRGFIAEAVQQFIHASQYRSASGWASALKPSKSSRSVLKYRPLIRAFEPISRVICTSRDKHGLDVKLYAELLRYRISVSDLPADLKIRTDTIQRIESALLPVYHPEKPSAWAVRDVFRDPQIYKQFAEGSEADPQMQRHRKWLSTCILDAADLLTKQGNPSGAQLLSDLVGPQSIASSPYKSSKHRSCAHADETIDPVNTFDKGLAIT